MQMTDEMKRYIRYGLIGIAGVLGIVVVFNALRGGGGRFDQTINAREVTIQCTETNEEWTVLRGEIVPALTSAALQGQRARPIDPAVGLPSPKNGGKPTAFPKDRKVWDEVVKQANLELSLVRNRSGG